MRRLSLYFAFLLLIQSPASPAFEARVVGITDGDTLTVLKGREPVKIRLYGIDAPETGQPFGTRAKQRASELAFGKTVGVQPRDIDRYGRTVVVVTLPDGQTLNRELVADGLAWWYERYAPDDARLRQLQAEAKAARRGLWADPSPIAPWDWRHGTGTAASPPGLLIGNRRSRLFHVSTCPNARRMGDKNRVAFDSPATAEAAGYRRAADCR